MGLGLLGRGVGDAEFLAACGAELIVTDLKTAEELAPSIERLKNFRQYYLSSGRTPAGGFRGPRHGDRARRTRRSIRRSSHARGSTASRWRWTRRSLPSSPPPRSSASPARAGNPPSPILYMRWRKPRAKTRSSAAMSAAPRRSRFLLTTDASSTVILELDSWQLQGFEDAKLSPHISVWTNFLPDHMNYYKGDMDRYFQDKAAIARFQKPGDHFVTTREIKEKIESRFGALAGTCVTGPGAPRTTGKSPCLANITARTPRSPVRRHDPWALRTTSLKKR